MRHAEKVCNEKDNKSYEQTTPPAEAARMVVGNLPKDFEPDFTSPSEGEIQGMPEKGQAVYTTEDVSENRTIQGRFTEFNVADLLFTPLRVGWPPTPQVISVRTR